MRIYCRERDRNESNSRSPYIVQLLHSYHFQLQLQITFQNLFNKKVGECICTVAVSLCVERCAALRPAPCRHSTHGTALVIGNRHVLRRVLHFNQFTTPPAPQHPHIHFNYFLFNHVSFDLTFAWIRTSDTYLANVIKYTCLVNFFFGSQLFLS